MIKMIQDFQVTLTGGFAIYGLTCMAFVTIVGLYGIGNSVVKRIKG